MNYWLPPMWSLDMVLERVGIEQLRETRSQILAWRREQASKRDPAPKVSKKNVAELSELFGAWVRDMDKTDKSRWQSQSGTLTVLDGSFYDECAFELKSYERLRCALQNLTKEERVDLAALAWFARRNGGSWTDLHEHAAQMIGDDYHYEIGLGKDWIDGLRRWEEEPGSDR